MAKLQGIFDFQIYPQPGFQARRSDDGTWTGSADFVVTANTWAQASWRAQFENGRSITSLDPSLGSYFSFLTIESQSITRNEAGLVTISVEVIGSQSFQFDDDGLGDEAEPVYRLEGRLIEMPFSEHPKFKALDEVEQVALGKLMDGTYGYGPDPFSDPDSENNATHIIHGDELITVLDPDPITSADAIEFALRIAKGRSTYLVPTITYTESTTGKDPMTPAQLNLLGYISVPRGEAPTAAGNRNWMLTGAAQEQRGKVFRTDIEWTLSERGGYDTFLYVQ